MATRYFALALGAVYTLVGILGFIPGALTPFGAGDPALAIDALGGRLLGIFPVNILHTLVHLAVGLWGLASFPRYGASVFFSRSIAVIFGLLFLLGLIPGLDTLFGLVPLFGNDVWLHFLTAAAGAFFGFVLPSREPYTDTPRTV